ncbi:condensin-2 complex subunit H2 [Typha latifolia]|uniref:condensin-2 complex subunit H2 n=1 Tax=Typha latifolia TaxID=4733 RepID=UPI003C30D8D8
MTDQEGFAGVDDPGEGPTKLFHILQPNRDLQSNWEVDLAKNLEEYLLKICSGEISADQDHVLHSVNFAEAALLLQGSVQVYSRKVEYLYSLVLHALEFLSQKRQDQQEKSGVQPAGNESSPIADEDNEMFLGLDDVPVDTKNRLDGGVDKDDSSLQIRKPPANLLVLEGDCLDTCGDAGELESYMLATCDFYGDFLLLDPCDAGAVHDFLQANIVGKEHVSLNRGSSVRSRTHHSVIASPSGRSGGTARKSTAGKNKGINLGQNLESNFNFEVDNNCHWSGAHADHDYSDDGMCQQEEQHLGCSNAMDGSDNDYDDPWKPLNPHEPGNLKIKPFRKVKASTRKVIHTTRQQTLASQFPIAKLDGVIMPEFASLERQLSLQEKLHASKLPPLYEKLRRSLTSGKQENYDSFGYFEDDNIDTNSSPDYAHAGDDLVNDMCNMDSDFPACHEKQRDGLTFDGVEEFAQENLDSHESLEDLCRSHLDALLASIAETEKQTELAARVSTWTQRIEHTLEEQDMHPPFDIQLYGERILDKLTSEAEDKGIMSFTNVALSQESHEVARTFSALLQLVNNGNIDLQRAPGSNELVCHTANNPFYIRLICQDQREVMKSQLARKRVKSPSKKGCSKINSSVVQATSPLKSLQQNGKFSVKPGKGKVIRCTPEGKRRRRSARFVDPFDLQSSG